VRQFSWRQIRLRDGDAEWVAHTDNANAAKRLRGHHGITTMSGPLLAKS
jgi:hypothetical protein